LVGEPEGKRPLGRLRLRWEDNIRMDLREIGWEGVNWIHMDRVRDHWRAIVNMEMNLRVPQKSGEFLDYLSDSAPLSQLVSYLNSSTTLASILGFLR
jgi:hypothetical protein